MAASELLRHAHRVLSIEDVYVHEASAWTRPDFDPLAAPSVTALNVQFHVGPQGNVQVATYETPGGTQRRVRYVIDTGLRLLRPDIEAQIGEPSSENIAAEISAKFVVRYLITTGEQPEQSMLEAFADNAVHHMWPYWREFLQATTARLRLPPVVLPMRVVQTQQPNNKASDVALSGVATPP
jgi:hypothetical protein